MATQKFYLSNTFAAVDPDVSSGWNDSTGFAALAMTDAPAGSNVAVSRPETSSSRWDVLLCRWVTPPITRAGRLEASGTVVGLVSAVQASSSAAQMVIHFRILVITESGARRGTFASTAGGDDWTTTLAGRIESAPASLTTPVNVEPGDRVVLEFGYQARNTSRTSYTGTLRVGGTSSTELAPGDTGSAATSRCPHITFTGPNSSDLWTPTGPTERAVDASDTGAHNETATTEAHTTVNESGIASDAGATGSTFGVDDTAQARDSVAAGQLTEAPDTATAEETTATSGELTVPDERTGTDAAGTEAELTVPTDTADHVESTLITLPVPDSGSGEATVATDADLAISDTRSGSDAVTIETLFGDLVISIWAVDPDTGALAALPDYTKLTMSPERNGPGSISLDYPRDGLNFGLLRNAVTADRDLEVEIWNFGNSTGALRGYLQESSGDDVAEDASVWTFAGGFLELRMAEAIVFPQPLTGELTLGENVEVPRGSVTQAQWDRLVGLGYNVTAASENQPEKFTGVPQKVLDAVKANATSIPVLADPKRELKFDGVTVGELVHFILTQARARGALTDIATSFTPRADSQGIPWPTVVTTKYSPGATYESILNSLAAQGRVEWSVSWTGGARTLNCYVPSGRGVDRTLGTRPVVLRAGRNLAEAPRKWSVRNSATAMLGIGAEGFYADTSSLDAQTRRGRRIEDSTSSQNLATGDAVLAYAQRRLSTKRDGQLEVTHGLAMLPGEPRPLVAFDVGDWVYSQTSNSLDRYRVVQWTLSVDAQQQASATVTLNDAFLDAVSRQQKELDALVGGETVVGTSEDSNRTDTGVPSAPTGLVVGSTALMEGQDAYAVVTAGWAAVTTNTDGTAAADIDGYRVEWRRYSDAHTDPEPDEDADDEGETGENETELFSTSWVGAGTTPTTQLQFTTATGLPILVRVQAYDRTGNRSTWTELTHAHTTESDTTPPGVPSTPTGGDYLGTVTCTWDGLTEDGADMRLAHPDFSHVELHCSTTSMFTPDATTQIGQLYGRGTYTYADLPYGVTQYFRLVAVDVRGNASEPSGQGSGTPGQLISDDVFDGAVGSAKLADAAVTTAKINDLAVNDAKIGSLGVGKLTAGTLQASMIVGTGKIATANSGARVEMDSAGLRLYDSSDRNTVNLAAQTGSAMVSGEYRTTASSGVRMILNPGGGSPAEMRFYPSNTNQYARMMTLTSVSPTYPNQAGVSIKGYSPRSDRASGEVSVFPNYASIAWANEMDSGSNVQTRVSASAPEAVISGPRVHISAQSASPYSDSIIRIGILNNAGTGYVPASTLKIDNGGTGGLVRLMSDSPNRNCGFMFVDAGPQLNREHMVSTIGENNIGIPIAASRVHGTSSILNKEAIEDVPLDLADTVRRVKPRQYEHADERRRVRHRRGVRARKQLGLIAEELPPQLQRDLGPLGLGVDLYDLIATVWAALRQEIFRTDALETRVQQLENGAQ